MCLWLWERVGAVVSDLSLCWDEQSLRGEGLPRTGGGLGQESPSVSTGQVLALGPACTKAVGFQSWDVS